MAPLQPCVITRGRTCAPPLFVMYQCPRCLHAAVRDAYAGPPVCLGERDPNARYVRTVGPIADMNHGHPSTPMHAVRIV